MNLNVLFDRRRIRACVHPTKRPSPSALRPHAVQFDFSFSAFGRQKRQVPVNENVAFALRARECVIRVLS